MEITALGKLEGLHPGTFTRMFIVYLFVCLSIEPEATAKRERYRTGF